MTAVRPLPADVAVTGVEHRSGRVMPGDLYVALSGRKAHGADFAAEAQARGAVAILTDPVGAERVSCDIPVLVCDDPRVRLGAVAGWAFGTAHLAAQVLGVTGTNGKTSVTHCIATMWESLGVRYGFSSTAERRIGQDRVGADLTTPEAPELHALLARMVEADVEGVALEVSAQALSRHRVDGVRFAVVGFTNLSHDHLDDYPDFEAYFAAKVPLFRADRADRAVISLNTPWGRDSSRQRTFR